MERRRLANGRGTTTRSAIEPEERKLLRRIWIHPDRCGGRPCIRGHRIPVAQLLDLVASGLSAKEICSEWYPTLTTEDVKAAVVYAAHVLDDLATVHR